MRGLVFFLLLLPCIAAATECKLSSNEEFQPFFERYSHDKEFALSRTVYPLRFVKWEYGLDEKGNDAPAAKRSSIAKQQQQKAPILSTYMKDNGLVSLVKKLTASVAIVNVFKEGTDWQTSYHFARKGYCWLLLEYQDHSL